MEKLSHKTETILKFLAWTVLTILLLILFFTKVIGYVAPFLTALLITFIIEAPTEFLQNKLKFPRGIAVAVALLTFIVVTGGIVIFAFYKIINELWRLAQELAKIDVRPIIEYFQALLERGQAFYFSLPEGLITTFEESFKLNVPQMSDLMNDISVNLTKAATSMASMAASLPQIFIFIVISLVATYFMSRDREKISAFIYRQIPPTWGVKLRAIKDDMFLALVGFIKAQMFLISITFIELLIGYLVLGVKYAFFFALLTAIVDALPVLGTGTILIPVAAFHLVMGDIPRAFAFIILYLVITVVRQFLEPKVVGHSLGLHPLVTLMAMYIGLRLFGVLGMLVGPVVVIILKTLQKARILPVWKT